MTCPLRFKDLYFFTLMFAEGLYQLIRGRPRLTLRMWASIPRLLWFAVYIGFTFWWVNRR